MKKILSILLSIAFFYGFLSIFVNYSNYAGFSFGPFGTLLITFLVTILFFITISQLFRGKISKKLVKFELISYFVLIFCFIMFKSFGIRGISLNIFDIVNDFRNSPLQVYFNILVFIPLGSYFYIRYKNLTKTLLYGFLITFSLETLQFIFALGISDILDILTNLLGTLIGYLFFTALTKFFSVKSDEKYYNIKKSS